MSNQHWVFYKRPITTHFRGAQSASTDGLQDELQGLKSMNPSLQRRSSQMRFQSSQVLHNAHHSSKNLKSKQLISTKFKLLFVQFQNVLQENLDYQGTFGHFENFQYQHAFKGVQSIVTEWRYDIIELVLFSTKKSYFMQFKNMQKGNHIGVKVLFTWGLKF